MKCLISVFTTLFLLNSRLCAREGWFWQNPYPQGNHLYDVCAMVKVEIH